MATPRQFSLFVIAVRDILMLRVGGLLKIAGWSCVAGLIITTADLCVTAST